MSRSILFITKNPNDAAARYRAKYLFDAMGERGWTVRHVACSEPWARLRILLAASRSDITFVQRKLFDPAFAALLRMVSRRLVFDFDDAIFVKSSGKPSARRAARFRGAVEKADLVLAGNGYLAAEAHRFSANVETVPTCVPLAKYPDPGERPAQGDRLVWIGSRSTSKYLKYGHEAFTAIAQRCPDARLRVIGDFEWSHPDLEVESVPWSEAIEQPRLAASGIGVAPMPDNPWTRGKCALKVLQYMACGLPVVSSATGANAEVIEDGVTGFLVSTPAEWADAVEKLLANPDLRSTMGHRGRNRLAEHFSTERTAPRVAGLLEEL